jgi:hydrogenase-4 component B
MSLALVFTASNVFFFLVAWEVMALSAFCLVIFEHEKEEARNAGVLFLVMSHAGTGLLLIAFLLLTSVSGSLDFLSFHLLASSLSPLEQGAVFLLFRDWFRFTSGFLRLTRLRPAMFRLSCRAS